MTDTSDESDEEKNDFSDKKSLLDRLKKDGLDVWKKINELVDDMYTPEQHVEIGKKIKSGSSDAHAEWKDGKDSVKVWYNEDGSINRFTAVDYEKDRTIAIKGKTGENSTNLDAKIKYGKYKKKEHDKKAFELSTDVQRSAKTKLRMKKDAAFAKYTEKHITGYLNNHFNTNVAIQIDTQKVKVDDDGGKNTVTGTQYGLNVLKAKGFVSSEKTTKHYNSSDEIEKETKTTAYFSAGLGSVEAGGSYEHTTYDENGYKGNGFTGGVMLSANQAAVYAGTMQKRKDAENSSEKSTEISVGAGRKQMGISARHKNIRTDKYGKTESLNAEAGFNVSKSGLTGGFLSQKENPETGKSRTGFYAGISTKWNKSGVIYEKENKDKDGNPVSSKFSGTVLSVAKEAANKYMNMDMDLVWEGDFYESKGSEQAKPAGLAVKKNSDEQTAQTLTASQKQKKDEICETPRAESSNQNTVPTNKKNSVDMQKLLSRGREY